MPDTESIARQQTVDNPQPNPIDDIEEISLALSGGGFRATLFHLGVIGFLREHDLLGKVKRICSVSGGSILAGHMIVFWDDYAERELEDFQKRACQLVDFIRTRDLSGRILRRSAYRLLLLKPLPATKLAQHLAGLLSRPPEELPAPASQPKGSASWIKRIAGWFRGLWSRLQGLVRKRPSSVPVRWDKLLVNCPELYILATHLNTGLRCAFSRDGGFELSVPPGDPDGLGNLYNSTVAKSEEIAHAVAASAAFPPVFEPLPALKKRRAGLDDFLTDGGAYDNSGIRHLQDIYNNLNSVRGHLVIASNAGRAFPKQFSGEYGYFRSLALRVTDTQFSRIAESDQEKADAFFRGKQITLLRCELSDRFPSLESSWNHSSKVQELLGLIRTELDIFSAEEVLALYRHGYQAAQKQYIKKVLVPRTGTEPNRRCRQKAAADESVANAETPDLSAEAQEASDEACAEKLAAEAIGKEWWSPVTWNDKPPDAAKLETSLHNSHRVSFWRKLLSRRDYLGSACTLFTGILLFVLLFLPGLGIDWLYQWWTSPSSVAARGRIGAAESIYPASFVEQVPVLYDFKSEALRSKRKIVAVVSKPIGELTDGRPHRQATAEVHLEGPLTDVFYRVVLERNAIAAAPRLDRLTLLPQGEQPLGFQVPPGDHDDRFIVLLSIPNDAAISPEELKKSVFIELED